MVVCRYFVQGTCRFGGNCRFEHVYASEKYSDNGDFNRRPRVYNYSSPMRKPQEVNSAPIATSNRFAAIDSRTEHHRTSDRPPPVGVQNPHNQKEMLLSVVQDVESAESGNQWEFSCYAPLKEGDNCPGFEDISPEEQRFQAYLSRKDGSLQNFTQLLEQIKADLARKRKLLKHPTPEVTNCLMQLFQRIKIKDPPAVLVQSSSNFGSITTASNLQSAPVLPTSQNVLGSSPPVTSNTQRATLFGGSSSGNAFGNASTAPGNAVAFAKPVAVDAFSFKVSSPGTADSNVTPTRQPLFGGGASMSSPTSGQSIFGGSAGNTSVPVNTNINQSTPGTNVSLFGGSSVNHPAPTTGLFGKPVSDTSNNGSFFGKKVGDQSTSFGMGSHAVVAPSSVYTPLDDLSEAEKHQFLADTFTPGQIPERPPPKELCF